MRPLQQMHPLPMAAHLLSVILIAMFLRNPILLCIALAGAGVYSLLPDTHHDKRYLLRLWGFSAVMIVASTLLNPLWNQRGETVMLFINDRAVTAEALRYGMVAGLMLAATLLWFAFLASHMTSERILCLLGGISPQMALVVSMGLRQSARLSQIMRQIREARRVAGLAQEDNLLHRTAENLHIFSATLSWSIENGIITADSMAARCYGVQKRTRLAEYRFRLRDGLHLGVIFIFVLTILLAQSGGALTVQFYPCWQMSPADLYAVAAYLAYGLLCLYPAVAEIMEVYRWRRLRSVM